MIITKSEPFTKEEIEKLAEVFEIYIKTVIDIDREICSAGMRRHFEGEQILLDQGSKQYSLWGGGIDLKTKMTGYNSLINNRSRDGNPSEEILDQSLRKRYEELTAYFFKQLITND